ncbi:Dihydroorotate dehydrogenase (quinone), mitochondrial [Sphaceloma murrayae]|uniref:Dihydroorotate dehydrogenase (quinone), mitochondrial n=1 Tax=Sphaceloma murrayae TaxID=2082308 RepID=A0A2K1QS68_9PEZI|nr:Dihydroorotate dehydrogenase (quinone), mitochondrial [Sphaceloma murrayae]
MNSLLGWPSARQRILGMSTMKATIRASHTGRQLHTTLRPRTLPLRSSALRTQHRHASEDLKQEVARQEIVGDARSGVTRLKNFFFGTSIVLGLTFTYLYVTDTRASIHQWLVTPIVRVLYPDAEEAHKFGNKALKGLYTFGLHPRERGAPDAKGDLKVEVFGHVLDNPIGTSAGIDKNAEIPDNLFAFGPAIVEVGGATPRAQDGNPKPRVWRIPSQNALINRYGLNSEGADNVAMRLRQRVREFAYSIGLGLDPEAERKVLDGEVGVPPGSLVPGRLLAVQCAKMKDTPDGDIEAVARDYTYCVDQLAKYADIIVVNVSSPNTPGLRSLQQTLPLTAILTSVVGAAKACDRKTKPAVMVKVSPDEDSEEQVRGICDAVWMSGVDGVIVGNTTKKRPDPLPRGYALPYHEEQTMLEQGGYSGPQLFERTVSLVRKYRQTLDQGPPPPKETQPPKETTTPSAENAPTQDPLAEKVEEGIERDTARLKPLTPEAEAESKQPLLKLPERHEAGAEPSHKLEAAEPAFSASTHAAQGAQKEQSHLQDQLKEKVIFATGGITNGKQALEVLNAGASVAQVYTALVYGGAGTISRIKKEMREEISQKGKPGPL